MTIHDLLIKYSSKINHLDLELIIAHELKKTREFVLAHPEARVALNNELRIKNYVSRRMRGEPLAYILGHKEFYGLDFKVDKSTLIPRPETELLVELAIYELTTNNQQPTTTIDVGTGSGNIISSIAKAMENFKFQISNFKLFGIDISSEALKIAKYNAKRHGVSKKIKFLKGNLLNPIIQKLKTKKLKPNELIILANLPYLSPAIYKSTMADVKKYEPKSALLSPNHGLAHYEKLFQQINKLLSTVDCKLSTIIEISPEQKPRITKIVKKYFPQAKIEFKKDLAGKWRVCKMTL